jgi:hypothetical protein
MEPSDKTSGVDPVPVAMPPAAGEFPKVLLCLPWQKQTNPMTAFSVMNLVDRRRTAVMLDFGDAFVAHARNTCATQFLSTPCEWLLMVDDDMIVPFGQAKWFNAYTGFGLADKFAGINALERLLSHGKSLVGALYFGRHEFGAPMYCEGANVPTEADYARKAPYDLIKPTRWVATGCLLIHRTVFEDIEKKFPRLSRAQNRCGQWFSTSEHTAMDYIDQARATLGGVLDGESAYKVKCLMESASAEAKANSGLGAGEDVQFCIRAKEAGHQPYVDMGCLCGHVGSGVFGPSNTRRKR